MADPRPILFLDLATKFGWCEGTPGKEPTFGTERFAPEGSGSGAVFGGAFRWMAQRCQATAYRQIVIEATLDPRHLGDRTTRETGLRLIGLPAVIEAAAYLCKVYEFHEARVDDIRLFVVGKRLKKAEAKAKVIARIQSLGFDVADPDVADAVAGWLYSCNIIAPDLTPPLVATREAGEQYDPYRGF